MSKALWFLGVACLVLAVVILLFADGLRRWYSGLFFLLIGAVLLVSPARARRGDGT